MKEYIIDCFAGGGGASVGIEMALGRQVDIAINHDPDAILMHKTNHPDTLHLTEDIFKVDLQKYLKSEDIVKLMWGSPDCTSHSKAKGGKPRKKGLRILPWAIYRLCRQILIITGRLPECLIMENVEEIQQWGPLNENGNPIPERKGEDYNKFIRAMKKLGFDFDSKELIAADYGAPTTRKRWYAVFRSDGREIIWPEQTHSKTGNDGLEKWIPISTYLDFSDLGKSIFGRKKPLAQNTMNRIARGIDKFVLNNPEPFMIQVNHSGESFRGQSINEPLPTITQKHGFGVITPFLIQYHSETGNSEVRGQGVNNPIMTIDTSPRYALASGFLTKFYKTGTGQMVTEPIHTITTSPGHFGQISIVMYEKDVSKQIPEEMRRKCNWVASFVMEYYGCGTGQSLDSPLHTIVTKDRFALVTVCGVDYVMVDIFLRMLTAEELKLGQGFPEDYVIDRDYKGNYYPISKRIARIGNSVVPVMAKVLVEVNTPYLKIGERQLIWTIQRLQQEMTGQMKFA